MTNKVNQEERAAIGWSILSQVAINNELIRYAELGKKIGIHHRPVRYVLNLIQNYCLDNHLPPLTILVVNETKRPGTGFVAWDIDHVDEGVKNVYEYNWNNLANPFGFAKEGLTEDTIIENLLEDPNKSNEMYAKIKVRGIAQSIFRKMLLKAYKNKCAFCDFSFIFALQASHIIPWANSTSFERLDVRNGILLCATHHKLFDKGILTINEDYSINYNDSIVITKSYSKYDSLLTTALHNKKINLPKDKKHWPNKQFLNKHRINNT